MHLSLILPSQNQQPQKYPSWRKAMCIEFDALVNNDIWAINTWGWLRLLQHTDLWVVKGGFKLNFDLVVVLTLKYKVSLIAKGYHHE